MALDFFTDTHTLTDYNPFGATYSQFDAKCNPSGGYINISVRVKWDFDFGWSLWNTSKQSTFRAKFKEMVNSYWSERYAIILEGNSDSKKVKIIPTVAS